MKELVEYVTEAMNKPKGKVYKYEAGKESDNPSKFKDKIRIDGYKGNRMPEKIATIYVDYAEMVSRPSEQFQADCLATIKEFDKSTTWCEICAWDQDENDFVSFATASSSKAVHIYFKPEFIGSNPEFHKILNREH